MLLPFRFSSVIVFGVMLFLTNCNSSIEKAPRDLIREDTYVDMLVEFQLVRTHQNATPDKVNADSLNQLVFDKYGVNEEQFQNSHLFYQKQVRNQLKRVDKATNLLRAEEEKIKAKIDSVRKDSARADSSEFQVLDPDSLAGPDSTLSDPDSTEQ